MTQCWPITASSLIHNTMETVADTSCYPGQVIEFTSYIVWLLCFLSVSADRIVTYFLRIWPLHNNNYSFMGMFLFIFGGPSKNIISYYIKDL